MGMIRAFRLTKPAALLCLGFVVLSAQAGQAQPGNLKFFKNYFITGDYVVGGVGLEGLGVSGIATGTINMGGVPANAEILAAFLYWQVVSADGPDSGTVGAKFRGHLLTSSSGPLAIIGDPAGTAPCWSSGGGTGSSGGTKRTYSYRADVLRFLPTDTTPPLVNNGKFLVNDADLIAAGLPLHTVELPDMGNSNSTPRALGASLVVIYRDPDPTKPLNAIVIYDGSYTMDNSTEVMNQTIKGFYDPALVPGQITHIAGSGQANKDERLLFNGSLIEINPFQALQGPSWDNVTRATPAIAAGQDAVTTRVDHEGFSSFDCLTWGAVIYRTEVNDSDSDGLLNRWETISGLLDPNNQSLPDLAAMGASPLHKDLFVEIGHMFADGDVTDGNLTDDPVSYGGVLKPAHTHEPTAAALKMVGEAFKNAPVANPDFTTGINVHFDLGNAFPLGTEAEPYIVRGTSARGGEAVDEMTTVCTRLPGDPPWVCQFSAYPGTVGWKTGFRFIRDEPLSPADEGLCETAERDGNIATNCVRRFDRTRKAVFHYALFAHLVGLPESEVETDAGFHVPRTFTGVADFPGGDLLVTLGAFDNAEGKPVGSDNMQANTLMHELGHNFHRRHGGEPGEPNCKPQYFSVMNYLYQLRGLNDDGGVSHVNYSGQELGNLNETFLADGALGALPYRLGWYAPQGPHTIGSAATKHCNGSDLLRDGMGNLVEPPMVRVDAGSILHPIDWNADGELNLAGGRTDIVPPVPPDGLQDVNFDGVFNNTLTAPPAPLRGSNDWGNLRLNQIGSRRNVGGLYEFGYGPPCPSSPPSPPCLAVGPLSLDVGQGDLGQGDLGQGDLGQGDLGQGDLGQGDLGQGDLGQGDLGQGDLGQGDLGQGDLGVGAEGEPFGEVTLEIAAASGFSPPNELKVCVLGGGGVPEEACDPLLFGSVPLHRNRAGWKPPNVGVVSAYRVYRVEFDAFGNPGPATEVTGSPVPASTTTLVDPKEFSNGVRLTYFVVATLFHDHDDDPLTPPQLVDSGPSNFATITAVNFPPVANADNYNTNAGTALVVAAPGVLANDTDVDSATLTAVLNQGPSNGMLTLNANGSFTYTPNAGFAGTDSFSYKAKDVTPISIANVAATVTITVLDITPPVVNLEIPPPTGSGGFFKTSPVIVGVSAMDASSNVSSFTCLDNGSPIVPTNLVGLGTSKTASGTLSVSGEGTHNLTCTATDSAGNSGAAPGSSNTGTVKIDTLPPTVEITAPANNATYLLNQPVAANYSCSDTGSGVASCVGPVSSGSNFATSKVGTKTFSVDASDVAGNTATKTNTYQVNYQFSGFFSPLGAPDTYWGSNQLGNAQPIKYRLSAYGGTVVSDLLSLQSLEAYFTGPPSGNSCPVLANPIPPPTSQVYSPGGGFKGASSFRFDLTNQQFIFTLDTAIFKPIPGEGCYTIVLRLLDGQVKKGSLQLK